MMIGLEKMLRRYSWPHLVIALIVFAVIMLQIWHGFPRRPTPLFFLILFVLTGSVNYFANDRTGLRLKNAEQIFGFTGAVFYLWIFEVFTSGAEIGWALGQQYLLNGFFVNRLAAFYRDDKNKNIPWLAASFFAGAHAPNWFLMTVTFAGGYGCARIFLKERNLYLLAIAHICIGFAVLRFMPVSITRSFAVGPEYFLKDLSLR